MNWRKKVAVYGNFPGLSLDRKRVQRKEGGTERKKWKKRKSGKEKKVHFSKGSVKKKKKLYLIYFL